MLLYWIWLAELNHISLHQKHRLLEQWDNPETLYRTEEEALRQMGLGEEQIRALQDKELRPAQKILEMCRKKEIRVITVAEEAYPPKLRNTEGAPLVLYYKGVLPVWEETAFVGIVGTRKATAYGLQTAFQMGNQIAAGGGMVVSGGAYGIDTAAMQGALDAQCPVIGVLGCGVDVVYPKSNRRLFEAVVRNGCLISEYPPQAEAATWHFPARNRIISGISHGVLVVEAPEKSGALITARSALEQGRDVFVVPGNINTASCAGSNELLRDGAIPVFSGWDVLREYAMLYPEKLKEHRGIPVYGREKGLAKVAQKVINTENESRMSENAEKLAIDNPAVSTYSGLNNSQYSLTDTEQAVLALLTQEPQDSADLIEKLGISSGKVLSAVTTLCVKGLVRKHPGGGVSLK